mmetsp:Transcript_28706/g.46415  ORF Transcript_28706/g.46415 Transcript_28706/m.46415 type:complete len:779 (+) Transcript_28706:338-2674(+)
MGSNKFWVKLRGYVKGGKNTKRKENGDQKYWASYKLCMEGNGVLRLGSRGLCQLYECIERDTNSNPSASLCSKLTGLLKSAASGLEKSRKDYRVFVFGFDSLGGDFPKLEEVFDPSCLQCDTNMNNGSIVPLGVARDARKVYSWIKGGPDRLALILAPSQLKLELILTMLLLLLKENSTDAIQDAHQFFARICRVDQSSIAKKSRFGLLRARSAKASTLEGMHGGVKAPAGCIKRIIGTLGELQKPLVVPEFCNVESPQWRKMVLRKVILSHAPRAEKTASTYRCRPYIMVMDGDQSEFIYSTMVQGIRIHEYTEGKDLVFDINCVVGEDIVIKLYNMLPGSPGSLVLKCHVNVVTAEPREHEDLSVKFAHQEQLVYTTILLDQIDQIVEPTFLDEDFQINCLFGMPEDGRELALTGPTAFQTLGSSRRKGAVVPPLQLSSLLPPPQVKCPNSSCRAIEYVLDSSEEKYFQCSSCATSARKGSEITRIIEHMKIAYVEETTEETSVGDGEGADGESTALTENEQGECDNTAEHEERGEQEDGLEVGTGNDEAVDTLDVPVLVDPIEESFESRLQQVCSVLGMARENIEQPLRAALSVCQSDEEADEVVQNFVTQALDGQELAGDMSQQGTWGRGSRHLNHIFDYSGTGIEALSNEERLELVATIFGFTSPSAGLGLTGGNSLRYNFRNSRSFRRRRGMGLSASDISRLPIRTFRERVESEEDNSNTQCMICINSFESGERLRTLPCFHAYHVDCIDRWLAENSKCPVCQRDANNVNQE